MLDLGRSIEERSPFGDPGDVSGDEEWEEIGSGEGRGGRDRPRGEGSRWWRRDGFP